MIVNMRYILFCCLTIFISLKSFSQVSVGGWQEYLSFSNVHSIDKIDNIIYAATDIGIYTYDTEEYIIQKYTKVNGLSDVDISTIKKIPNSNKLFIGYENGNIDIFENGNIDNIPDLKIKSFSYSKTINTVDFFNNLAYCATDFGILVVDYNKLEISDLYYIGEDATAITVNQIAHTSDSIFAATESGLRKASINSNALSFYETWEYISDFENEFSGVIPVNDGIITTRINNNTYETYFYSSDNWNMLYSSNSSSTLQNFTDNFAIIQENKIEIFYNNLNLQNTISEYQVEDKSLSIQCSSIHIDNDEIIWIGDSKNGLIKKDENNDLQILPDGPQSNTSFKIVATSESFWTTTGNYEYTNKIPAEVSILRDGEWINLTSETDPLFSNYNNICDIVVDPKNNYHAYLASCNNGILELENDNVIYQYNDQNSGLQKVWIWELVASIVLDDDGNLYANNQEVTYPIVVKPYDVTDEKSEWIQYDYLPYDDPGEQTWLRKMIYTSWGDIWAIAVADPYGLFVMDPNGTPYDTTDDTYRGPANTRSNTFVDDRYSNIAVWDEDGESISSTLQCLAEDKNGYIWIGTDEGPIVYYRPQTIFDEEYPQASKILVPRNDGTGLADYLLENENISTIVVDGANRKWFGTQNGVYLISEDGTETINHFTTENSPLISNSINSISINPESGEVFIATDKGIVSYLGTATEGKESYNSVTAFPNPVKPGYEGVITITGLIENSTTTITDISGKLVYQSISTGGQLVWNGRNINNKKVSSGIYLVFATNEDGDKSLATKIMIVR